MTQDQFNVLKEEFISNIKEYVIQNGGIFPHVSVFANAKKLKNEEETKPALIHIPIPDELIIDDEGKDKFVDEIFPEIAKEIKKRFEPKALAWTSEAWVRTIDATKNPNFNDQKENWKNLPIEKEVIIITIESNDDKECVIYDIIRGGKSINTEGELVDTIELIELSNLSNPKGVEGRFSGLYSKLKD
jgi:hypothetical protein